MGENPTGPKAAAAAAVRFCDSHKILADQKLETLKKEVQLLEASLDLKQSEISRLEEDRRLANEMVEECLSVLKKETVMEVSGTVESLAAAKVQKELGYPGKIVFTDLISGDLLKSLGVKCHAKDFLS